MATSTKTRKGVSFSAEEAFDALNRLVNEQRFLIERQAKESHELRTQLAKLQDAYVKHVRESHLAIEARLSNYDRRLLELYG